MEKIAHYCQKCSAPNTSGESNCRRCGTRLMLVVLPPSARRDDMIAPTYYEDHLLERVSLIELKLSQALEKLSRACELIERDAKIIENNQLLLKSFFESVEKIDPEFAGQLRNETGNVFSANRKVRELEDDRANKLEKILADHHSEDAGLFTHLVNEGIQLLGENEEKQAFSTLERAALLSPRNVSLHLYLAIKLFVAEKFDKAKSRLELVLDIEPQNFHALLLLGTVYADSGQAEEARKLLSVLANNPKSMLCVNYIWAILATKELKFAEALAAFKECRKKDQSPEINYLIGCMYFLLGKHDEALKSLTKAVSEDVQYGDAWFVMSQIFESTSRLELAREARNSAVLAKEAGAQNTKYIRSKTSVAQEVLLPFEHLNASDRRLLTGGARRLSIFLRKHLMNAIN